MASMASCVAFYAFLASDMASELASGGGVGCWSLLPRAIDLSRDRPGSGRATGAPQPFDGGGPKPQRRKQRRAVGPERKSTSVSTSVLGRPNVRA